jgi:hypothetical protein
VYLEIIDTEGRKFLCCNKETHLFPQVSKKYAFFSNVLKIFCQRRDAYVRMHYLKIMLKIKSSRSIRILKIIAPFFAFDLKHTETQIFVL